MLNMGSLSVPIVMHFSLFCLFVYFSACLFTCLNWISQAGFLPRTGFHFSADTAAAASSSECGAQWQRLLCPASVTYQTSDRPVPVVVPGQVSDGVDRWCHRWSGVCSLNCFWPRFLGSSEVRGGLWVSEVRACSAGWAGWLMGRTLRGRDWTSLKVRVVSWGRVRMGWCSGCWTCWRRRGAGRRQWGWPPPSPPSSSSSSPSSSTSTSLSTSAARREYRYFAECLKRQLCKCLLWESPRLVSVKFIATGCAPVVCRACPCLFKDRLTILFFQVCYFSVFLVGCLLHLAYFASTSLALLWAASSPFVRWELWNNFSWLKNLFSPSLLPPLPKELLVALPPASRAAVGAIFLTVAALTVERYSFLHKTWWASLLFHGEVASVFWCHTYLINMDNELIHCQCWNMMKALSWLNLGTVK